MSAPRTSQAHYKRVEPSRQRPFYRRSSFWKIAIIALIVLLLIRHCVATHKKHPTTALPVVVSTAKTSDVPVYFVGLGAVTPVYSVTVLTQINGQLLSVPFIEGQMVKRGDLLAQIDPRPYEAQLVQYQGQLQRDQALLAEAQLDLTRYKTLWSQDSIARQTYEDQMYLVKQDEGTLKIDQGLIQGIELNLYYCRIVSPIDGRVGLRLVDPGNYVQTSGSTGIAVVDTVNPITVIFTLPEDEIPAVQEQVEANQTLVVQAYDRAQTKLLATGTLLTMDNQINPSTGTVKLRAQFQNENNRLFPSQFVNVKLLVKTLHNATIVPTMAIQNGVQGTFIYVVNDKNPKEEDKDESLTVTAKSVVVGITNDDESTITSGIAPGEKLVVEGADKLTDGAKVTISEDKSTAKPTLPASAPTTVSNHSTRRYLA
ncbi:MAG: efflux RND transporter periplasmic adaptor subunit [Pseudomonadota bacterium]